MEVDEDLAFGHVSELDRWYGGFPGDHANSQIAGMEVDEANEAELTIFFRAAQKIVSQWRGNQFAGLLLYGSHGNGKTHAAIGLGRALHQAGADVNYMYVPTLTNDLKRPEGWGGFRSIHEDGMHAVFPTRWHTEAYRNNKHVLILDDYRSEQQEQVAAAIEAAEQYGAFVIMTANFDDPFDVVERTIELPAPKPQPSTQRGLMARLSRRFSQDQADRAKPVTRTVTNEALLSRIVAGFISIEFSSPDRRPQYAFWNQ